MDYRKQCYYFVFNNPLAFREFYLPDFKASFTYVRFYQYPHAHARNLCELDGRGTGKTEIGLIPDICQAAFLYEKDEALLTTYRQQHIAKPLDTVFSWFKTHPYWKHFVQFSVKQPIYKMLLKTGFTLYGICVGDSKQAEMIQGVHCCIRFIDEFQQYPDPAWQQFMGTASEKGEDHTIDKYTGVPDGRRDTPAWKVSQFNPDFDSKFDHFHLQVSKRLVPYFDTKTILREQQFRTDQEFKHQVDAEWGEEQWGYWDWTAIEQCINRELLPVIITITKEDYLGRTPAGVLGRIPLKPKDATDCIIGMDLGWTQPSVVEVFTLIRKRWRTLCRINLINKIIPENQAEIMDYLMTYYNASLGAIDSTSEKGVSTTLANPEGKFAGKGYETRIVDVEFNRKMEIAKTDNGLPIEENVKNATCRILKEMFAEREFELFNDMDLQFEFNAESSMISPATGALKIITPNTVHIPEAFRCFAYAYFVKYVKGTKITERKHYTFMFPFTQSTGDRWTQRLLNRLK